MIDLINALPLILFLYVFYFVYAAILFFQSPKYIQKVAIGIIYFSIIAIFNWCFINILLNYSIEYLRIAGLIGMCIGLILIYLSQFTLVIERVPIDEGEDVYEHYDE